MMKFLLYILLITGVFASLDANSKEYAEIYGHVVDYDKLKDMKLFKTERGLPVEIASSTVSPEGFYGFVFLPEQEGIYSIGNYPNEMYRIYVKSGDETEINFYADRMEMVETNSKEMKVFYDWYLLSYEADLYGVRFMKKQATYKDFFPAFEKLLKETERFKSKIRTGNKYFDEFMPQIIEYDKDVLALSLLFTPRTKHSEKEDRPAYYSTILNKSKLKNVDVLKFPYGMRLMEMYMMYYHSSIQGKMCGKKELMEAITDNDQLRGELVLQEAERYKFYEDYLRMMDESGKYFVTEAQKKRAEAIGSKLYNPNEMKVAADFTYPDVNGKMVSLSDFKGKVVLVDVWATWCMPCRNEIPYLKKLEEEMSGKDVVFIGVSVDEAKNKQKWIDFVKKEDLKGIQLLASGWSKITEDYKIKGIPRFMIFDRQGNIVSINAPRPSDPGLKALLEKALK